MSARLTVRSVCSLNHSFAAKIERHTDTPGPPDPSAFAVSASSAPPFGCSQSMKKTSCWVCVRMIHAMWTHLAPKTQHSVARKA